MWPIVTIMHPPHRKNVFPPVANPIEQGCELEMVNKLSAIHELKETVTGYL